MFTTQTSTLIPPYGGKLQNLVVPAEAADALKAHASHLPSVQLDPQAAGDLELLAGGTYSPLDRFMGREATQRVLAEMRLVNGVFFPVAVTLTVEPHSELRLDREIALRGSEFELLGVMTVEEVYPCDSEVNPHSRPGNVNISGSLKVLNRPQPYAFRELRLSPAQVRAYFETGGWKNVFACVAGGPVGDIERLLEIVTGTPDGALLLQIPAALRKPGDFEAYNRVRLIQTLVERSSAPERVVTTLLPQARFAASPRENLRHALVARNFGANHLITTGEVHSAEAQELGVTFVPQPETEPEIVEHPLAPPRHQQGVCIWFTGLSGSGKSTTAEIVSWMVMEHGRQVTVLDGDVVRTHLSKGLGFSKEDRDTNVRRIGFVASELVRIGGVVVCSVVSPYRATRDEVRAMVGSDHFVEVFVDTPLEVCEARDVKGMYAKARSGALKGFTGIDDPYEAPEQPQITLDTVRGMPQENAARIIAYLIERGFLLDGSKSQPTV